MTPLTLIAAGNDADVYALDDDRVLRRYRDGGDVRAEAALMAHVHGLGYPVPRVHRADGPDLVLQRLTGPTLAESVIGAGTDTRSAARIMLDLHRRLHALPPLRPAGPGDRLLHLDLHPHNVVLTAAGPVVIDWRNADDGPPDLDVAVTAVLLGEVGSEPESPLAEIARALLVAYLAETGPLRLLDRAVELRGRLGPVSAQRRAEAADLVRDAMTRDAQR